MADMPARARKTRAAGADAHAANRTPSARDAAMRRLSRAKRWLLAGTVTLTGVLTAVAASAFPGKSVKSTTSTSSQAAASSGASGGAGEGSATGETSTLQAPAQEPESSGSASESPVVSGGS